MKHIFWFVLILSLAACQAQPVQGSFVILDGGQQLNLQTQARSPAAILKEAGLALAPGDVVQYQGADLPLDFELPAGGAFVLQIRRAHNLTVLTPDGQRVLRSSAANVGQALAQNGFQIDAADFVEPALETPLDQDMTVTYRPARSLSIRVDGQTLRGSSAAQKVGQALAGLRISLLGLDKSLPAEDQPLPEDGQIQVIRVRETVSLIEKSIPFAKRVEYSTDLEVGTQKVLQAGLPGLIVSRVRVRLEDGVEVARSSEAETVVRLPQDSIVSLGSKVRILTLDIPGGKIEYWRAVQMYATAYSPCRSGTSKCYYGTASGLPVRRGVVAMVRALYNQLSGAQVYVPGYGQAVIADVGGGFPDGRLWIDLGYSDDDFQGWSGWVTVYFLAPAPASIPAVLE